VYKEFYFKFNLILYKMRFVSIYKILKDLIFILYGVILKKIKKNQKKEKEIKRKRLQIEDYN